MIFQKRGRGEEGGQRSFGTFPKFHPFWCAHPSLMTDDNGDNSDFYSGFIRFLKDKREEPKYLVFVGWVSTDNTIFIICCEYALEKRYRGRWVSGSNHVFSFFIFNFTISPHFCSNCRM